jgi:hypothetical protein
MKLTEEQQVDITLLIATFRCFNEQLYNIKGVHSRVLKKKFNTLLNVAKRYESEIVKEMNNSKELEEVYDVMMDIIINVKLEILKDGKN